MTAAPRAERAEMAALRWHEARQVPRAERLLLDGFAAAIHDAVGTAGLDPIARSAGEAIAAAAPLGACSTVEEAERAANAALESLGWGFATFETAHGGVRVSHHAAPASGKGADLAFPSLLEGLYGAWFRALGAGDDVRARVVERDGGEIVLLAGAADPRD